MKMIFTTLDTTGIKLQQYNTKLLDLVQSLNEE